MGKILDELNKKDTTDGELLLFVIIAYCIGGADSVRDSIIVYLFILILILYYRFLRK